MAKKVKKSVKPVHHSHENNAKAVIALMVLALAFFVYLLFNTYRDNLVNSSNLQGFVFLVVLLFGLLGGLLYLINPSKKS